MATVHFALVAAEGRGPAGAPIAVANSVPVGKESKTPSGSNQVTTLTAEGSGIFWVVTAVGGDVWVKFGGAPVASAGNDWLISAGSTREFVAVSGHKAAVINV